MKFRLANALSGVLLAISIAMCGLWVEAINNPMQSGLSAEIARFQMPWKQ